MRALVLGALLFVSLITNAIAQLAVGPVEIKNNVNGVPITISATSWISVNSVGNEILVDARIFADLIDLQRKFSSVVGTFKLPADSCAKRGLDNQSAVVSFKSGSLWPLDDRLVMSMRGHIDIWSCVAGPSKSEIRWQKKKFAFVELKIPQLHTWSDAMKKNKDGTQPFHGSVRIHLVEKDSSTVALKIANSNIILDGQEVSLTDANLKLAKVDINQRANSALQTAIYLPKLKEALPSELQNLSFTIVSARFRDHGGHAIVEINLAVRVPGDSIPRLLQQVAASPAIRMEKANSVLYTLR
jgi:hypothetical protein